MRQQVTGAGRRKRPSRKRVLIVSLPVQCVEARFFGRGARLVVKGHPMWAGQSIAMQSPSQPAPSAGWQGPSIRSHALAPSNPGHQLASHRHSSSCGPCEVTSGSRYWRRQSQSWAPITSSRYHSQRVWPRRAAGSERRSARCRFDQYRRRSASAVTISSISKTPALALWVPQVNSLPVSSLSS